MNERRVGANAPTAISALGAALFLLAFSIHAGEIRAIDELLGPAVALLVDGVPALGLVYAGYRLSGSELEAGGRRTVAVWCFAGALLFVAAIGTSHLVRVIEGRALAEPLFPLMIAAEAGAIAGFLGGYRSAQAQARTRRAETATDAFAFVNSLIRHDLRNDLNVISGYAELLAEEVEGHKTETEVIADTVEESLERIETSEAIAGTLMGEADFERVDLAAVSAELADDAENTPGVRVTTDLPEHAYVTANAGLRSVVDNLVENAVEHNDAEHPRVHVAADVEGETVQLRIADNGPGLPEEKREALLERSDGATEGGLSLVRTLVEAYDGRLRIESNEPRGSVFVVELPRAA